MEQIPRGEKIYAWEEHESPYKLFRVIIADLGMSTGKLAICPNVRSLVAEGFMSENCVQIVDGSVITESYRAVKTEKELGYMDLANRITKLALKYGFSKLHEGMTQRELDSIYSDVNSQMGVSGEGWPVFGFLSDSPHGSSKKKNLEKGDVVLFDAQCKVEGYYSDVTRSAVFGKPTDRQKRVFEAVLKTQKAAFQTIRPGIYLSGQFGIRVEDSFVVRENGPSVLGAMNTEAIDMPFGK